MSEEGWKKPKPRVLKRKRTIQKGDGYSLIGHSEDSQSLPPITPGDKENADFGGNPFLVYQESIGSLSKKPKRSYDESPQEKNQDPSFTKKSIVVDLRPADKLRLVSMKPLPWMISMTTPGFSISKAKIGDFNEQLVSQCPDEPSETEDIIRAASMYHQYPDLPGQALFPRLEDHVKVAGNFRNSEDTRPLCNSPEQFFAALQKLWCDSFNDLYRSWRRNRGQTDFYVFCPQFTVLFTKAKPTAEQNEGEPELENSCWMVDEESPRHVVIINPTVHGFLDALRKEGVEFVSVAEKEKMPKPKSRRSLNSAEPTNFASLNSSNEESRTPLKTLITSHYQPVLSESADTFNLSDDAEEEVESEDGSESDGADWLRGIGIDSPGRTFKLKRSATVGDTSLSGSNMATGTTLADETLRSAIAIWNPSSIINFCDFFLYAAHGRASTGPQAGLPPTLVSSVPFLNSSLKSLSLSSHCVKASGGGLKYVLELDEGPILPHTVAKITEFVRKSKSLKDSDNTVEMTFNSRNFYTGFNQAADKNAQDFEDLERCEMKCPDFVFRCVSSFRFQQNPFITPVSNI
ncbi:hypothetical protein L596_007096 [Steinernema carpocapsae]|uniref:Uncharacterized protein n=1 Tax=Steinernema carpocapsae TaxID=34508 RepID=A0A4V6A5W0_STECR|nr:hypothetical protein L596_007096 [Steinernema carpocapsae]